jgi:RecJ-like exonuclease
MPFGAEFRCDHCGIISVLIIDRALVPLSTLQRQGERVCIACGRIALREARFCQEGHALVRRCCYTNCGQEFAIDHQRCDFCGKLQADPLKLHEVCQGTVTRVIDFGAFVDLRGIAEGLLHISEAADHRIRDMKEAGLKEGDLITVKILAIEGGKVKLSRKGLG